MLVTGLDKFVLVAVQVNSACRKDRSIVLNLISFLTVPLRNTVKESSMRRPDLDQVRRGGGIPEMQYIFSSGFFGSCLL